MNRTGALFAICFTGGTIGGLAGSLALWLAGAWGVTALAGVDLAPQLTSAWLYPRLVLGGLWGLVYFFTIGHPRSRRQWVRKGLWISLLPTAVQLFAIYPNLTPHGMLGMNLGSLTPLFVLIVNFVWGFFTGTFTRLFWGRG